MLDKILYVVGKSDMPLWLLQSVLSPFLWIGTMIDSFHSSGKCTSSYKYVRITGVVSWTATHDSTQYAMQAYQTYDYAAA